METVRPELQATCFHAHPELNSVCKLVSHVAAAAPDTSSRHEVPVPFNTIPIWCAVNENLVKQTADKMIELGLVKAGYDNLVIDGKAALLCCVAQAFPSPVCRLQPVRTLGNLCDVPSENQG